MESKTNSVDELFTRSKNIITSCFFELWDGVVQTTSERSLLLKSTSPVQTEESALKEKLKNILQVLNLPHRELGVDASGLVYIIFEYKELKPLPSDGTADINQKLSFYIKCLQAVEDLNEARLSVSDMSIETFRVAKDGSIYAFGVFASLFWEYKQAINSKSLLPYVSPELRMGSEPNNSSEVFASGVLGYAILCGKKYIKNSEAGFSDFVSIHPAPSKLDPSIQNWLDKILAKALDADAAGRFQSVGETLGALEQALRTGESNLPEKTWAPSDGLIVRSANTDISKKQGHELVHDQSNPANQKESPKAEKKKIPVKHAKTIIKVIWGSTILGILTLVFSLLLSYRVIEVVEAKIPAELEPVMPIVLQHNLRSSLLTFVAVNEMQEVNLAALREIMTKDYKLDLAILNYLNTTYSVLPLGYEKEVEKIVLHWLNFFGYQKIKDEVQKQLFVENAENAKLKKAEVAASVMIAANPQNSSEERTSQMRKLFQKSESFSFSFLGMLVEESSREIFLPVMRDFLSARGFIEIPKNASQRALFMLASETRKLLGSDIAELLKNSSPEDLKQIATALLSNTIKMDKEFFGMALKAYLESAQMGKFSEIFVKLAQNEALQGSQESLSIFKLTLGTATAKDLAVFIEWDNSNWEQLMYAILITNTNEALLDRAFEIISRRGPTSNVAKELLEWIKKTNWSGKSKYAYPYGVFALKHMASDEELEKAFNVILPLSNSSLFHALVSTEDPYFITHAVDRISPIVKVSDLIPLLSHENSAVRIAAVKSLVGKNDLPTLQKILANFRKEKDPEVIKVYNEFHWVTQDRQKPTSLTK